MSRYFVVTVPSEVSVDVSCNPTIVEEMKKDPAQKWNFSLSISFEGTLFQYGVPFLLCTVEGDGGALSIPDLPQFLKAKVSEDASPSKSAEPVTLSVPVESFVRKILEVHSVHYLLVTRDGDMTSFQFPSEMGDNEPVISSLVRLGVGSQFGCYVLMPVDLGVYSLKREHSTFSDSVSSRMVLIEQMIRSITEGTEFTFDYVAMIMVAGILAGVGLATNNSVVVVASMLVSPLMGPILGMTFGLLIHDTYLIKQGILSEIYGLLLCVLPSLLTPQILSGFLVGVCGFNLAGGGQWPSVEMSARGQAMNLAVGVAIAAPSGIGAALSVSGSNTSGLVGVAISASLLPPAVNCGILIIWALLGRAVFGTRVDTVAMLKLAGISFALTVVNIACIIVFGIATFYIKEAANLPGKTAFWNEDVKRIRAEFDVHRFKTAKGAEGKYLQLEIEKILRQKKGCCGRSNYSDVEEMLRKDGIDYSKTPVNRTVASYTTTKASGIQHQLELMSIFDNPMKQ